MLDAASVTSGIFDDSGHTGWQTRQDDDVHDTDREQLAPIDEARRIAAYFDGQLNPRDFDEPWDFDEWKTAGSSSSRWGVARVCQVKPGRVLHVIGDSAMAKSLRELLSSGAVAGWSLQPMADTRTPLREYLPKFHDDPTADTRGYSALEGKGFRFGAEVVACPDDALLAIRTIGPKSLATIRRIIGGPPPAAPLSEHRTLPVPPGSTAHDRAALLEERLTPITQARYPELVTGLAASEMPNAAVAKIVASLNAESAPPADPLVTLLLETAGELEMLRRYRATHTSEDDA